MNLSQNPLPDPDPSADSAQGEVSLAERQFEETLVDVERSLHDLKARYTQVRTDQQRQVELQERLNQVEQEFQQTRLPELQTELRQIKTQLEELEVNLESRLFAWSSFREVFWQIVRFGGLGVVLGWLLSLYTLKNPTPSPEVPTRPSSTSQPSLP